jgi:23S rRNA (uridine2552-2'-O)-methyltransferase
MGRRRKRSHWRTHQQSDRYFRLAKEEGYRARSAYKLKQIDERFHILHRGDAVVDLGAAPGSWSQVVVQRVGRGGKVVAVDLQPIEPIPGVVILQGDMTDPEVQARIEAALGGPADVVLSDAAPFTTGIKLRDHVLSMELGHAALATARRLLRPGGSLVIKVFEGEDLTELIRAVKQSFHPVKLFTPDATRNESWESFIVARGFKGKQG